MAYPYRTTSFKEYLVVKETMTLLKTLVQQYGFL